METRSAPPKILRIGERTYDVERHVPATTKVEEHVLIRGRHWSPGSSPTVYPWPPRLHIIDRRAGGTVHLKSKI